MSDEMSWMCPKCQKQWRAEAPTSCPACSSFAAPTLLGRIGQDLEQERKILNGLAWLCEQGKEGRIAHEIGNASRALTEAIELIKLYESGEKLPTLEEMRGILVRPNGKISEDADRKE